MKDLLAKLDELRAATIETLRHEQNEAIRQAATHKRIRRRPKTPAEFERLIALLCTARPILGFDSYWATPCGLVLSTRKGSINLIAPATNKTGYLQVTIQSAHGPRSPRVHQCVALAFYGAPNGLMVRHLNGNRLDNRVENLRYGTAQQNTDDAIAHGKYPSGVDTVPPSKRARGSRIGCALFTEAEVARIKRRIADGENVRAMARELGCAHGVLYRIKYEDTWRHVEAA